MFFKNRTKELMKVITAIGCFPERRIKSTRTLSLALLTWNRDSLSIYYVFGTCLGLGDASFTDLFISI